MTRAVCCLAVLVVGCPADPSEAESGLPAPNGPVDTVGGSSSDGGDGGSAGPSTNAVTSGMGGTGDGSTAADCLDADCTDPPNDCFVPMGTCSGGACVYQPKALSADCDDGDDCSVGDACDGGGVCVPGDPMDCTRDNAEGGTCVAGECQGWTCLEPYEDCDNDMANGCEIPTGVALTCNNLGIQTDESGCGTAYCGTEVGANIVNFNEENYRCVMCSNCREIPMPGWSNWCNLSNGQWWPDTEEVPCPGSFIGAICPES